MSNTNNHPAESESVSLQEENDQRQMRSEHLAALYAAGKHPYGQAFERTCTIAEMVDKYQSLEPGEERAVDMFLN